jgi:hypothetical protein
MTTTVTLPYGKPTANKLTLPDIGKLIGWAFSRIDVDESPTQYLLNSLQESEKDYKAGRYKSFATGQDALDYLDAKIITGKKNK